jgi:hypothetical protein
MRRIPGNRHPVIGSALQSLSCAAGTGVSRWSGMPRSLNRRIPLLKGRNIPLSLPRRFVGDLLHFAKRIPSVPMQRRMDLSRVIDARACQEQRISWCAIFIKAYSMVADRQPELRRTYLSFPWGKLYEHPANVASFGLERDYHGESALLFAKIAGPERLPLATLDAIVRTHKAVEIEAVDSYCSQLRLSRLPLALRRWLWWLALEVDGRCKAYFFGTFSVSAAASLGAAGLHILSPLATTLNYSPFDERGCLDVRITYDHRVHDGAAIARALISLEEVLQGEICEELSAAARIATEASSSERTGAIGSFQPQF